MAYKIEKNQCLGCRASTLACPFNDFLYDAGNKNYNIRGKQCVGCNHCTESCPGIGFKEDSVYIEKKMKIKIRKAN